MHVQEGECSMRIPVWVWGLGTSNCGKYERWGGQVQLITWSLRNRGQAYGGKFSETWA